MPPRSTDERFEEVMEHIRRSEDRIKGDIAKKTKAIQGRIDALEVKMDAILSLTGHLSATLLAMDVFAIGYVAKTAEKEELKSVLEWWRTVDFEQAEVPDQAKSTLVEKHKNYEKVLETLAVA